MKNHNKVKTVRMNFPLTGHNIPSMFEPVVAGPSVRETTVPDLVSGARNMQVDEGSHMTANDVSGGNLEGQSKLLYDMLKD